jgi:hypothetical protein
MYKSLEYQLIEGTLEALKKSIPLLQKIQERNTPKQQSEKDWEVVSFDTSNGKNDKYYPYTLEACLERGYKIKSVKRLSDNEVFSIGDKISINDEVYRNKTFEILSFQIDGQQGRDLMVEYKPNQRYNLEWVQKVKQPLFADRPPLGLMPEYIHKEQRLKDIKDAIGRYLEANMAIPISWVAEQYYLECWIENKVQEKLNQ